MKFTTINISIENLINRNKILASIINSSLHLLFFVIRKIHKSFAYDNGNIVAIVLHRLGDTVFTIPAIREIQKHYNRKIIIVCFPELVPIYSLVFANIDFCTVEHEDFYYGSRISKIINKRKLKLLRPEYIFDLTGGMNSASLILTVRSRELIGINKEQFRYIYDRFIQIRKSPQLIDIYLDVISTVIKIPDRNELKKISVSNNPEGKILIHPFAAWKEKEWNLSKFIELALKLKKDFAVNFISPPGKLFTDVIDEINKVGIDIIETKSVDELIRIIKECSLFIGNDSGPVNIANFLSKPTFTIYGATNPDYTATSQEYQLYTQKKLGCSARSNEKFCIVGGAAFICPGIQCMNLLSLDEVYNQLKPLTDKYCVKKLYEIGDKII